MQTSTDLIVAKIDQGRRALAEARTIPQAKAIADIAAAAEIYARRQKLGAEAEGYARELRLDAERLLGEMLKLTAERGERVTRQTARSSTTTGLDVKHSLGSLGIDKKTSARAQKLAKLPPEKFEAAKRTGNVRQAIKEADREARAAVVKASAATVPAATDRYELHHAACSDFARLRSASERDYVRRLYRMRRLALTRELDLILNNELPPDDDQ